MIPGLGKVCHDKEKSGSVLVPLAISPNIIQLKPWPGAYKLSLLVNLSLKSYG